MEITDVTVKLAEEREGRVKAYCSIVFDHEFVVQEIRVISGQRGLFVAMPSRKKTEQCPGCSTKCELQIRYCHQCGKKQPARPEVATKAFTDVAHPISKEFREILEARVLLAVEDAQAGVESSGVLEGDE